jgi:short-subunit dehydrogenase
MTRTLIVFGAGPGIGDAVAAEFACKGIDHIILLARNTQRLQNEDAPFVSKSNPSVKVNTLRIDLADLGSIPGVLKELDSLTKGEDVEVIFFNAARIRPSEVLSASVEEIDEDFKVLSSFLDTTPTSC